MMKNRFLWTVETSRIAPQKWQIMRGETVELVARLANYREPLDLSGASATAYWQTPDMGDAWYTASATVSADSVTWTWTPDNDAGASAYDYFLGVEDGAGLSYRPFGKLEMMGSPSPNPSAVPIPTTTLDFSRYTVLNAPYYTQSETADLLAGKADVSAVPSAVSQLRNDAGYLAAPVGTSAIADGAITNAKVANNAVTTDKVAANAITTAKIANNAVTDAKLSATVRNTLAAKIDRYGDTMESELAIDVGGYMHAEVNDPWTYEGQIVSPYVHLFDQFAEGAGVAEVQLEGTLHFTTYDPETWDPVEHEAEISQMVTFDFDAGGEMYPPIYADGIEFYGGFYGYEREGNISLYAEDEGGSIYCDIYFGESDIVYEERMKRGNVAIEAQVSAAEQRAIDAAQYAASNAVSTHNSAANAHTAIRNTVSALSNTVSALSAESASIKHVSYGVQSSPLVVTSNSYKYANGIGGLTFCNMSDQYGRYDPSIPIRISDDGIYLYIFNRPSIGTSRTNVYIVTRGYNAQTYKRVAFQLPTMAEAQALVGNYANFYVAFLVLAINGGFLILKKWITQGASTNIDNPIIEF